MVSLVVCGMGAAKREAIMHRRAIEGAQKVIGGQVGRVGRVRHRTETVQTPRAGGDGVLGERRLAGPLAMYGQYGQTPQARRTLPEARVLPGGDVGARGT